jgi:hypothetical protein
LIGRDLLRSINEENSEPFSILHFEWTLDLEMMPEGLLSVQVRISINRFRMADFLSIYTCLFSSAGGFGTILFNEGYLIIGRFPVLDYGGDVAKFLFFKKFLKKNPGEKCYFAVMKHTDKLSSHYSELLEGTYDCMDRIVLNAYFLLLHGGVDLGHGTGVYGLMKKNSLPMI